MRRLIQKKVWRVKKLWCLNGWYEADMTGLLYIVQHKFLWWKTKPYLEYDIFVPYIAEPYYNGEYATNERLSSLEVNMRAEMESLKERVQRRLDRLLKRRA